MKNMFKDGNSQFVVGLALTIIISVITILVSYDIFFKERAVSRESGKAIAVSLISSPRLTLTKDNEGGTLLFNYIRTPGKGQISIEVILENQGYLTVRSEDTNEAVLITFPTETRIVATEICTLTSLDNTPVILIDGATVILSNFTLNPNNSLAANITVENGGLETKPALAFSSLLTDTRITNQDWPTSHKPMSNTATAILVVLAVALILFALLYTRNPQQATPIIIFAFVCLLFGAGIVAYMYQSTPTPLCS